ncbi:MAG TPA: hypothetical protein VE860_14115 [Chthoniobacterales bacterium]|nr:hypothetical protein [Chthoniobacterales bacterium]
MLKEEVRVICAGILLVCLGMALIGFGRWYNLDIPQGWPIYLAGSIFCLGGLFYLGREDSSAESDCEEPPQQGSNNVYLGTLHLNGYLLKAYECETDRDGTRFRLVSTPAVTPQKEAALIRYIVNEGLIENISRGMSKKIEEEAGWAFFQ